MNPKVTVMVANYNTSQYLAQCFDSLRNQSYINFEVQVVDDGSTDNSIDIIQKYVNKDKRFRLMKFEQHRGVAYIRNAALPECRGEYIAILDADDLALPERLEKQVEFLDNEPGIVLLGSYYGVVDSKGQIKRKKKKVPVNDIEIRWRVTQGNCFIHSTIMFRKQQALDCGGYDASFYSGEDFDLYSKIISLGKAAALPEVLVFWRTHKKSMTKHTNQNELDRYYFMAVKNAVKLHFKTDIELGTAEALYFNTKAPAKNPASLKNALKILLNNYSSLYNSADVINSETNKKLLARCLLQHLYKIYKRNCTMIWWHEVETAWFEAMNELFVNYQYSWLTDWNQMLIKIKLFPLLWKASKFH